MDLVANAADVGPYLLEGLRNAVGSHRHDVRGVGLLAAVEFVRDLGDRVFFETKAYPVSPDRIARCISVDATPSSPVDP